MLAVLLLKTSLALVFMTTTNAVMISDQPPINVTFGDIIALYTFEGTDRSVKFTVNSYGGEAKASLKFDTTDASIFQIVNQSTTILPISPDDVYPKNITLTIRGVSLGIENLLVLLTNENSDETVVVGILVTKVNLQPKVIMIVIKYVMLLFVIVGFVNMGGTIDLKLIWQKLRRPWGVLIGMFCQFFVMPPLAFGLATVLSLDSSSAIGLVLDGSCPGGYLSNILSVMLDVDYVLSLTMTFCSNILAMGMMPLNLFIYTPPIIGGNQHLETPFMEIGIQLVLLFIPISIGMFFKYKSPRINRICDKLLKPLSTILLVLLLATSLPFQLFIFAASSSTYIAAFLLPLCGSLIGSIIAKLACLPVKSVVTVALETGVQNAILATTIITFFYPHPESEIASRAPYLILLMTIFEGFLIVICYYIVKTFIWKQATDEEAIIDGKDMAGENMSKSVQNMNENGVSKNKVDHKDAEKSEFDKERGCQTDFNDGYFTNLGFIA